MIGYLTLGSNDLEKAAHYYDSLLNGIGATRAYKTEELAVWSFGEGTALFSITKPFDGNPATVGNGVMIALEAESPEAVDVLHAEALRLGGTNEGDPGQRGKSFYIGYFRDLDGNKLNFFCRT